MEWIFLVLAVAVLVFGIGVLVVNRRRSAVQAPTVPSYTRGTIDRKPQQVRKAGRTLAKANRQAGKARAKAELRARRAARA